MSLIAWYKLNGDSLDSSGNEYHAYEHGSLSYDIGKVTECLVLDGSTDTGLELLRHDDAFKYQNFFSISLWFKSNTTSGDSSSRIMSRDCSDYWCWNLDQSQNYPQSIRFYYSDTQSITISDVVDGEWNNLISTWDLEKKEVKFYVDGVEKASVTNSDGFNTNPRPIVGGGNTEGDGDISGQEVVGDFDDIKLFDHVLSLKEVKEIAKAKVFHYSFNESDDSEEIVDVTGNGYDSSLSSSSAPEKSDDSKIGISSYYFNGTSTYIDTGSAHEPVDNLNAVSGNYWTVSAWFKTTTDDSLMIVGAGGGTGSSATYALYSDNGILAMRVKGSYSSFISGINDGDWHHVATTWDGSGSVVVYFDGENVGDASVGTVDNQNYRIIIGATVNGGSYHFEGNIDDVRLYSKALSSDEINELYQTRLSLDNNGNFNMSNLETVYSHMITEYRDMGVVDNTYKVLDTYQPDDVDVSNFVESDDTLGNFFVDGWVYCSSSTYYPTTFEYTKENNDKGVYGDFATINGTWVTGWNRVYFEPRRYDNAANTPWDSMTRLQVYRSGDSSGVDTSQYIIFKDLKINKFINNEQIKEKLINKGIAQYLNLSEVAITDNLIGWWRLNGDALDLSGNHNNGDIIGPTLTNGLNEVCYYFDGSDDSIDIDNSLMEYLGVSSGDDNDVSYSISALFNIETAPTGVGGDGASIAGHASSGGIGLQIFDDDGIRLNFGYRGNNNYNSNSTLTTNTWYHVVCTREIGGNIVIYINGDVDREITGGDNKVDYTSANFQIGYASSKIGRFNGKISDVRVYNSALSSTEARILYDMKNSNTKMKITEYDAYIQGEINERY